MDNYAKLVKQMHWPTVSPRKKKEISDLRKSMEKAGKPLRKPKSRSGIYTEVENEKPWKHSRHTKSQAKIDWSKFSNPMIPKEKPKRKAEVVDYLLEISKFKILNQL